MNHEPDPSTGRHGHVVMLTGLADHAPPSDLVAAACQGHLVTATSSPAAVMIALARGATTLLIASPAEEISELLDAVRRYYSQVTLLQWNDPEGEAEPLSGDAEKIAEPRTGDGENAVAATDDNSSNAISARSLVTDEEFALLTRPLDLNASADGQASGEEGS